MADAELPTAATLSSLSSQVNDMLVRVGADAEASDRSPTEGVAAALYDAERALRSVRRALERAERALGA